MTTAMQRKRSAGKRAPKRPAPPWDPSDDLDYQRMVDQDSDGYWVRQQYEGIGPIMWGLAVALVVLVVYAAVGRFA